jgi:prepilin-type processing-associated H-X9-DG protein
LGIFQYKQDYDEKLPLYLGAPGGWLTSTQPYLKSTQIFQCPSEANDPSTTNFVDYWINIMATGQSDSAFDAPASTVLLGDGVSSDSSGSGAWSRGGGNTECGGWGTTGPLWTCAASPTATLVKATLPSGGAHRHLTGANITFADGHVKWQKGVSDTSDDLAGVYIASNTTITTGGAPTFSIK